MVTVASFVMKPGRRISLRCFFTKVWAFFAALEIADTIDTVSYTHLDVYKRQPNMLTTPLSIVAGIVFGDYTVNSGWFNSEIMLYMAFVAVANYTQANMELGYAIKLSLIHI